MQKYIVAFGLPEKTERTIRQGFKGVFGRDLGILNLHITIIPPFFIESKREDEVFDEVLKNTESSFRVHLGKPEYFVQGGKKNFHFSVIPTAELEELKNNILDKVGERIKLDASVYFDRKIPEFIPHLTMDYNFNGSKEDIEKLGLQISNLSFDLSNLLVFEQKENGVWKEVAKKHL